MHQGPAHAQNVIEPEAWTDTGVRRTRREPDSYRALAKRLWDDNQRLRRQVEELLAFQELAYTDPLTGLGNRRRFDERIKQEWSRWQRYGASFSVVMIDLNGFKQINDTWGHAIGDSALCTLASYLVGAAREVDFVCRLGGDEFALLLPHTTSEGGQALIDRIGHTLRTEPLRLAEGQELCLEAGFGIATTTSDTANAAELIEQADAAMYHSKRSSHLRTV